jgi:hypothetical protein
VTLYEAGWTLNGKEHTTEHPDAPAAVRAAVEAVRRGAESVWFGRNDGPRTEVER